MGVACTRPLERVLASLGQLPEGASSQFESCRDVSYGGVLCALPALIANGLFRHSQTTFPTLTGYYTTLHVILLLAYMALCRIRAVEQLQYESPGELGKLPGLDRVPEVRCLRQKLKQLSGGQDDQAAEIWAGLLAKDWMDDEPELAGTLYVDGHVRLYHGKQTELPRRYVSRQHLRLRGTTDYWVNDALGQPFFSIERPIKLMAYRAETAMSGLLRESLRREDDSRSLLRDIFRSDADLVPDDNTKVLEVRIHTLANPRSNRAIQHLLTHLNATDSTFPGTDFRLHYTLGDPASGVT
jgi:hypothetical protein